MKKIDASRLESGEEAADCGCCEHCCLCSEAWPGELAETEKAEAALTKSLSLADLPKGRQGVVKQISAGTEDAKRLMAFGFLENTKVEALYQSPSGNPVAYCVRGVVLALRQDDAKKIIMK